MSLFELGMFPVAALVGYLMGSIPTAYLVVKTLIGKDIRKIGSGNVGATNVARIVGGKWGFACFTIDFLKGFAPALVFKYFLAEEWALCAGLFAVVGHMYTFWLKGSGGKGVATGAGFFFVLAPVSTFYSFIVFFVVGPLATRTISAGAIAAAIMLPLMAFSLQSYLVSGVALAVCIFVIFKHSSNLERLYEGTESRLWDGIKK